MSGAGSCVNDRDGARDSVRLPAPPLPLDFRDGAGLEARRGVELEAVEGGAAEWADAFYDAVLGYRRLIEKGGE